MRSQPWETSFTQAFMGAEVFFTPCRGKIVGCFAYVTFQFTERDSMERQVQVLLANKSRGREAIGLRSTFFFPWTNDIVFLSRSVVFTL